MNEAPDRGTNLCGVGVDSSLAFFASGMCCRGVQMGSKKNKKKLTHKWFPEHDLYLAMGIVLIVAVLTAIRAFNN